MLKIFLVFNFRTLWRVRKFFNYENFSNYSIGKDECCCWHDNGTGNMVSYCSKIPLSSKVLYFRTHLSSHSTESRTISARSSQVKLEFLNLVNWFISRRHSKSRTVPRGLQCNLNCPKFDYLNTSIIWPLCRGPCINVYINK